MKTVQRNLKAIMPSRNGVFSKSFLATVVKPKIVKRNDSFNVSDIANNLRKSDIFD